VINWTVTNSVIVLALARYFTGSVDILSWFIAALVAWMTQGFPAHIWNDIYDWLSGTDKLVDIKRSPTGGSHTIQLYYKDRNVFGHLKNHIPWIVACAIGVYYFGFVLGWWWYVVLGGLLAVYISVFYSTPPIQADHRPFFGEWCHAFPGILLSNAFIYYAAAHIWPSPIAVLCMLPYVIGNIFMLEMHHVNDIYPDLHAKPKKKHTAVSWIYERTRDPADICRYFTIIASAATVISLVLASFGVFQAVVFAILYLYGIMELTSKYVRVDFEKYPEYLSTTVPLELRWIMAHTVAGWIFAGITVILV
jgi:1,4-dihydroxy-2-naphthoate octaprenyltransferase